MSIVPNNGRVVSSTVAVHSEDGDTVRNWKVGLTWDEVGSDGNEKQAQAVAMVFTMT